MGFKVSGSCSSKIASKPHLLDIVVEFKALGPPRDLKLWLGETTACAL